MDFSEENTKTKHKTHNRGQRRHTGALLAPGDVIRSLAHDLEFVCFDEVSFENLYPASLTIT